MSFTPLLKAWSFKDLVLRGVIISALWLAALPPSVEADVTAQELCIRPLNAVGSESVLKKIEERYESINSLQAKFSQDSLFVGLDRRETSAGEVSFLKPGKMHWRYTEPELQHFIADGETVWFYQPSLNQVTIDQFQTSFNSELPVTFLLGIGRLSDAFTVQSGCELDGQFSLQLEPKAQESTLQKFTLTVRASDYAPAGARVLDLGGNETTIRLHQLTLNGKVKDSTFQFQIPRGVDVIDQRTAKPQPIQEQNLLTAP